MTTLSVKRQAFVNHYATNGGNGAQAYRDAGYSAPDVSTATTGAHRLLTKADVASAIDAKRTHLQAASDISRADVIAGLALIAQSGKHESARVSAWSKLADILGLIVRKVDIQDNRSNLRDELAAMTLSEVLAVRDELARALPEPGTIDSTARELHDGSAPGATNSVEHPRNMRARTL
jgi:phage terminase small subunit